MNKKVKMNITNKVFQKMMAYARASDNEISGLGLVNDDNLVYEIVLFEQTSSGSETNLDTKKIHEYINKLTKEDPDKIKDIKLWWHSHANMGVSWSSQDEECIEGLLKTTPNLYSVVVNKKGSYKIRLDFIYQNVHFKEVDVDLKIQVEESKSMKKLIQKKSKTLHKHIIEKYPNIQEITFEYIDDENDLDPTDIPFAVKMKDKLPKKEWEEIKKEVEDKNKEEITIYKRNYNKGRYRKNYSTIDKEDYGYMYGYGGYDIDDYYDSDSTAYNTTWNNKGFEFAVKQIRNVGGAVQDTETIVIGITKGFELKDDSQELFGLIEEANVNDLSKEDKDKYKLKSERKLQASGILSIFSQLDNCKNTKEILVFLRDIGLLKSVLRKVKTTFKVNKPIKYLNTYPPHIIKSLVINYFIDRITAKKIKKEILFNMIKDLELNTVKITDNNILFTLPGENNE